MNRPAYRHARWGLLEVSGASGRAILSRSARTFIAPGAAAGLFPVAAAWSVLGAGHRFVTPVYAVGSRTGDTLTGNLVLGGRTTRTGSIAYTSVDHSDAGSTPGAALTPQNPLAGLDRLARQVRLAGITQVAGNMIIDTRLFAGPAMSPAPAPVSINDNLIDVQTRPGQAGGPARLSWRPRVAPYRVTSKVRTQYARFILKTGDRLGANLAICLLAVHAGQHDCQAGFPVLRRFLRRAGVSPGGVQLTDGAGTSPADRVTPAAVVALLRYWLRTS